MSTSEFEKNYTAMRRDAVAMAQRVVGNRDDAEDVVGNAVLKAVRSLHTFQDGADFRSWFARCVYNAANDWYRQRRPAGYIPTVAMEDYCKYHRGESIRNDMNEVQVPDPRPCDMDGPVMAGRIRVIAERVIADLPDERHRALATGVMLNGERVIDMARALGYKPVTANGIIFRVRAQMREALTPLIGN